MNIVRAIGQTFIDYQYGVIRVFSQRELWPRGAVTLSLETRNKNEDDKEKKEREEEEKMGGKNIGDGRRDEAPAKRRTSMSTEERKRLCGSGSNCGNCSTTFPFVRAYTAALTDINIQI